jgi:excisionase family DNA binding protein
VDTKRVLTVQEVAKQLGMHPISVRRAIHRGQLPAVRVGTKILIPVKALDEFLESRPAAASG